MLMPADPFDGTLQLDGDGYLIDSSGLYYGKETGKFVQFFDSRGMSSRVNVKLKAIRSVKPADDPQLHAVIVSFDDDADVTYYGLDYKPDEHVVFPERHGGVFNDIDAILRFHCPNLNVRVWSDELTGSCYVDGSILEGPAIDRDMDESIVDTCRFIADKSKMMWGKVLNVSPANCRSYLESEALKNKRNLFLERIEACAKNHDVPMSPGEGVAYDLFEDVGMLAPVLEPDEASAYMEAVNRSTLLSVLERQYEDTIVEMAPCFIGEQGSGKTSLCRFMGNKWYKASTQDVHNIKPFMESVVGGVIVEFREGLQLMNPETLKEYLDRDVCQYRKAYDRKAKSYRIQFVTIMTTNDPNPLHDLTGARRVFPMYMRKDMPGKVKPYELTDRDWEGMWAQAYHDYHHGIRWRDSMKGIEELAEKMQAYASTPPAHYDEMVKALSYWPNVGNLIPIPELKATLRTEIGLNDRSILEALDGLRRNPLNYGLRVHPKPFKYCGQSRRGYIRVETKD